MSGLRSIEEPYISNPFRLLRLPANASNAQIQDRTEEATIEARLSSSSDDTSRLSVLTGAQAELLDPLKRLHHEILWFYDPPECVYEGELGDSEAALTRFRTPSSSRSSRQHDLALWLLVEACHCLDSDVVERWTVRALSAWRDVTPDTSYLTALSRRDAPTSGLARIAWQEALTALAASSSRNADAGRLSVALAQFDGAKSVGLANEDLISIVEPTVDVVVLRAQVTLADAKAHSQQFQKSQILNPAEPEPEVDSTAVASTPLLWAQDLKVALEDVRSLHDRVGDLVPGMTSRILNEAAYLVRGVAISVNNERDDSQTAVDLIDVAMALAASPDVSINLETDRRVLRNNIRTGPLHKEVNVAMAALEAATTARELQRAGQRLRDAIVSERSKDEPDAEAVDIAVEGGLSILRAIAVKLHNAFRDTSEAADLIAWCISVAKDEESKTELTKMHRQLQFQLRIANCLKLAAAKQWASVEVEARLAYSFADSATDRAAANQAMSASAQRRNSNKWKVPVGALVALSVIGLAVWGAVGGSSSNTSSQSSNSAPAAQIPISVPGINAPSVQCVNKKSEIDSDKSTLTSLESQLQSWQNQYPNGAPQSVVDQFNATKSRYNALLTQTNILVDQFNSQCATQ